MKKGIFWLVLSIAGIGISFWYDTTLIEKFSDLSEQIIQHATYKQEAIQTLENIFNSCKQNNKNLKIQESCSQFLEENFSQLQQQWGEKYLVEFSYPISELYLEEKDSCPYQGYSRNEPWTKKIFKTYQIEPQIFSEEEIKSIESNLTTTVTNIELDETYPFYERYQSEKFYTYTIPEFWIVLHFDNWNTNYSIGRMDPRTTFHLTKTGINFDGGNVFFGWPTLEWWIIMEFRKQKNETIEEAITKQHKGLLDLWFKIEKIERTLEIWKEFLIGDIEEYRFINEKTKSCSWDNMWGIRIVWNTKYPHRYFLVKYRNMSDGVAPALDHVSQIEFI